MVTYQREETERTEEVMEQWLESNLNCTAGATNTCTGRRDHPVGAIRCLSKCLSTKTKTLHEHTLPLSLLLSQSIQSTCSDWSLLGGSGTSWKPANSKYSHQAASCASPSGATFSPSEAKRIKKGQKTYSSKVLSSKWSHWSIYHGLNVENTLGFNIVQMLRENRHVNNALSVCNRSIRQMQKILGLKDFELTLMIPEGAHFMQVMTYAYFNSMWQVIHHYHLSDAKELTHNTSSWCCACW